MAAAQVAAAAAQACTGYVCALGMQGPEGVVARGTDTSLRVHLEEAVPPIAVIAVHIVRLCAREGRSQTALLTLTS